MLIHPRSVGTAVEEVVSGCHNFPQGGTVGLTGVRAVVHEVEGVTSLEETIDNGEGEEEGPAGSDGPVVVQEGIGCYQSSHHEGVTSEDPRCVLVVLVGVDKVLPHTSFQCRGKQTFRVEGREVMIYEFSDEVLPILSNV